MDVICTRKLTTFSGQSRYQLNVIQIEYSGEGALLKQLELLKRQLQAEGLFSEDRKQKIPYLPSVIGVVTSPTGAVIRDILHRLSERFGVRVLIAPVPVQGLGAPMGAPRPVVVEELLCGYCLAYIYGLYSYAPHSNGL